MFLNSEEEKRYSRQIMGVDFSIEKQLKLKNATVMVAGIGGLGGTVALYLASAGVGRLVLVHAGNLELPDMNRQVLMSTDHIGQPRVEIAEKRLKEINPNIEIITADEWLTEENVEQYVKPVDIVVDCRHNFEERLLLNRASVKLGKVMVEGGMDDMDGYLTCIDPGKTPCLSCMFKSFPKWDYLGFAVIGVIPGTLAALMALEAIKIITGTGEPLYSKLLVFNGIATDFKKYVLKKDPDCVVCGKENTDDYKIKHVDVAVENKDKQYIAL